MATIRGAVFKLLVVVTRPFRGSGIVQRSRVARFFHGLYKFVYRMIQPRSVMIRGCELYLDPGDTLEFARLKDRYEAGTTAAFDRLVRPGDTVIDIGANLGYYTLLTASIVGDAGRVFAFEPDPAFFTLLKRTVERNRWPGVAAFPYALTDRPQENAMFIAPGILPAPGHEAAYADMHHAESIVQVRATTLDAWWEEAGRVPVHVLKMDIEGAEFRALRGMANFLNGNPTIVLLSELNPRFMTLGGDDPAEYLRALRTLGFTLYEIDDERGIVDTPSSDSELLARCAAPGHDHVNIVCLRGRELP